MGFIGVGVLGVVGVVLVMGVFGWGCFFLGLGVLIGVFLLFFLIIVLSFFLSREEDLNKCLWSLENNVIGVLF